MDVRTTGAPRQVNDQVEQVPTRDAGADPRIQEFVTGDGPHLVLDAFERACTPLGHDADARRTQPGEPLETRPRGSVGPNLQRELRTEPPYPDELEVVVDCAEVCLERFGVVDVS